MVHFTTDDRRAGHVVRIKAPKLAEAAVAEQYRRQADLTKRYGPKGRGFASATSAFTSNS